MNLFNKKILNQRIVSYTFPMGEKSEKIKMLIDGWQKALKDSNLSKTKEKSIQSKFLTIFFEEILGYIDQTSGKENWTIIAEPKTEVDSQVADGSLGFFTKDKKETKAVIELKDAKTSLDKKQKGRDKGYTPVEQGYLYATKFDRCKWVIISNFREIRLYSKDRSQDFVEKFEILELHKEDVFKRFYYLLNSENLLVKDGTSPVEDLSKKSLDQEEDISKKFYTEYKQVRLNLYEHLTKQNEQIDKVTLFKKSQKILDRIVFILFCEDTANLLPKNILKDTYEFGTRSRQRSDEKVWLEMKNLFMDIDEGRSDIEPAINGYNGGLFKADGILDSLIIKDEVWKEVVKLSEYDFESDLNVNILGHIFEQSISDIENIKAEIEGTKEKKTKSKRKKDGIFYTPEYITKYIVENTVGKYLEEHPDKLDSIKILDPACGSGAFLNQAHSFLMNEYKVRYEEKLLKKEKKGEAITLFDYNPAENNRSILLNNLYGVDLNDESVEISKLSLWLKTARKDEPLQSLDNNLKVGNSLIDDPEVAGDKAFDWDKEYKDIMKDGGFDVIVGNPPYVKIQEIQINYPEQANYYPKEYKTATAKYDLYVLFVERAYELLKDGGLLAFIMPHKFTGADYGKGLRGYIAESKSIEKFISFGFDMVFEDVTAYTGILILRKNNKKKKFKFAQIKTTDLIELEGKYSSIDLANINENPWALRSDDIQEVMDTLKSEGTPLEDIFSGIFQGIITGDNNAFYLYKTTAKNGIVSGLSKLLNRRIEIEESITHEILGGKSFERYYLNKQAPTRIIYPYALKNGKSILMNEHELKKNYPRTFEYLNEIKERLSNRGSASMKYPSWYSLWNQRELVRLSASKILTADIASYTKMVFDQKGKFFHNDTTYALILPEENENAYWYYLGLLNSKLSWFYIKNTSAVLRGGFRRFKTKYLKEMPIIEFSDQLKIGDLTTELQEVIKLKYELITEAIALLTAEYPNIKENTLDMDSGFNLLIEHISKGLKQDLSLSQKEELQKWFKKKQKELQDLQNEIDKLDREIDQEVYKLYGLTQEEINVIEEAV